MGFEAECRRFYDQTVVMLHRYFPQAIVAKDISKDSCSIYQLGSPPVLRGGTCLEFRFTLVPKVGGGCELHTYNYRVKRWGEGKAFAQDEADECCFWSRDPQRESVAHPLYHLQIENSHRSRRYPTGCVKLEEVAKMIRYQIEPGSY